MEFHGKKSLVGYCVSSLWPESYIHYSSIADDMDQNMNIYALLNLEQRKHHSGFPTFAKICIVCLALS